MSRSFFANLHRRYGERLSGAERQQTLRTRLDAFTDELLSPSDLQGRSDSSLKKSVIIVGGGLAGLKAAWNLTGCTEVTVFEAQDRVGGRVCSFVSDSTKRITEAGGELIGYAHPTWLTLARRFNLSLVVWTSDGDFDALRLDTPTYIGGRLLSASHMQTIYDEMNAVFAKMARDAQLIKDPNQPWIGDHAGGFDQCPLSKWIDEHSSSPLMRKALEIQFANTNGAPSTQQSYLANLALVAGAARHGKPDDFFTMSENVRCAEGNAALATALAGDIVKRGGTIHLSSPISSIRILENGVSVTPAGGNPVPADFVILAIPPSVWPSPRSELVVDPPIPQDYYMTMGTAVKYLSRSSTRFWIAEGRAPSGVSDQCGMVWEGTDNQMQTPDQDVELTVFAGGNAANAAIEAFGRGDVAGQQFYDDQIAKLYPAYPSHRLGTNFINWPLKPWTMGGYSCPAPGDVCRVGRKLIEPFSDRLYFAGEHTCLPFFGYMEGALQSGTRAAQAILRR